MGLRWPFLGICHSGIVIKTAMRSVALQKLSIGGRTVCRVQYLYDTGAGSRFQWLFIPFLVRNLLRCRAGSSANHETTGWLVDWGWEYGHGTAKSVDVCIPLWLGLACAGVH